MLVNQQLGIAPAADTLVRRREWRASQPDSIDALQVVYKVAERCNINCSYCYYFHMGDETPLERPAYAPHAVTERLAHWMADGCAELRIPHAKLAFHGGEPAMIGADAFGKACRTLRDVIEPVATLSLAIQTNGVLLDERWTDRFIEHAVGVGISIDGPQAANDRFRLDKRGRSTFQRSEDAIRRLVAARPYGAPLPSTISVLHSANDYRDIYHYLRDLGVEELNFLLPDRNVDDTAFRASDEAADYGRCLSEIFDAWLAEDNQAVRIKFIDQTMVHFRANVTPGAIFRRGRKSNQVVIARSDGTVAIDDSYIPALDWYSRAPVRPMATHSLRDFLGNPIFQEIETTANSIPTGCRDCRWRDMCRGGDLENRFSAASGFDNPSVYCGAYKGLYATVCQRLVEGGYPAHLVTEKFGAL
ncbi:hypothetical protein ATM17_24205 [Sphingopyxis macrogoltabida]|uniref:Radical SAM core domain-containing protein n=1 Tax=Sphingopyxis macrogoltabida TaxID=33050 RepID=A0AAC9AY85_SPHMC|nr:hypothetical protein LH19_23645 [Sphingopyxis macrogoltabida]AMU92122.1 hypothetical protein ATM17_24205 [Sphingopyxis macrogoltabida]